MNEKARERLVGSINAVAPDLDADTVESIVDAVFTETVAGASLQEMSRALGQIRASRLNATYPVWGSIIWQMRYDNATKEAEEFKTD